MCEETMLAVMKDSPIDVVRIQERPSSMDAGRGESKAIGQASLTRMYKDLTRA
jgi:hypothetical protein